ncbi:MAG: tellurite methyltransferase [Gammaproteobacteria bacterium]
MSQLDRDKWNHRYANDSQRKSNPVSLLEAWLPKVKVGRALDVACGSGRNSLFIAEAGFEVDGIDISAEGLKIAKARSDQKNLAINWIESDLDQAYPFDDCYDLIVVLWYVNLPLIVQLAHQLTLGGYLICEEHLQSDGQLIGPTNDAFRVAPNALKVAAGHLEILHYDESIRPTEEKQYLASAQLVARKPDNR